MAQEMFTNLNMQDSDSGLFNRISNVFSWIKIAQFSKAQFHQYNQVAYAQELSRDQ